MHHFKDKAWQTEDVFETFGQISRSSSHENKSKKIINTCPEMSGFGEFA